MAVFKRGQFYYIRFKFKGQSIYRSARTSSKQKALELEAKIKKELWDHYNLGIQPTKYWEEAVTHYLNENNKATISDDEKILRWLEPYLLGKKLNEITDELIETIKNEKLQMGCAPATVNHVLQVISVILKKAKKRKWIRDLPIIERMSVENKRIRWLTVQEANKLLSHLPTHLKAMAAFTLATGLRASNVRLLKWEQIDFDKKHAFVKASETKNKKALAVPLNKDAIAILQKQTQNSESEYVFTYQGHPVAQCSTLAWRKALKNAGIKNFRWHDLRHTWASWHIQSGTSLQELQALGGWSSLDMVLRYAHLSSDHLQEAADRITGAKVVQKDLKVVRQILNPLILLVPLG